MLAALLDNPAVTAGTDCRCVDEFLASDSIFLLNAIAEEYRAVLAVSSGLPSEGKSFEFKDGALGGAVVCCFEDSGIEIGLVSTKAEDLFSEIFFPKATAAVYLDALTEVPAAVGRPSEGKFSVFSDGALGEGKTAVLFACMMVALTVLLPLRVVEGGTTFLWIALVLLLAQPFPDAETPIVWSGVIGLILQVFCLCPWLTERESPRPRR